MSDTLGSIWSPGLETQPSLNFKHARRGADKVVIITYILTLSISFNQKIKIAFKPQRLHSLAGIDSAQILITCRVSRPLRCHVTRGTNGTSEPEPISANYPAPLSGPTSHPISVRNGTYSIKLICPKQSKCSIVVWNALSNSRPQDFVCRV